MAKNTFKDKVIAILEAKFPTHKKNPRDRRADSEKQLNVALSAPKDSKKGSKAAQRSLNADRKAKKDEKSRAPKKLFKEATEDLGQIKKDKIKQKWLKAQAAKSDKENAAGEKDRPDDRGEYTTDRYHEPEDIKESLAKKLKKQVMGNMQAKRGRELDATANPVTKDTPELTTRMQKSSSKAEKYGKGGKPETRGNVAAMKALYRSKFKGK